MADFSRQLEVNLFGPVAMIQTYLPQIDAAVAESSTSGRSAECSSCR